MALAIAVSVVSPHTITQTHKHTDTRARAATFTIVIVTHSCNYNNNVIPHNARSKMYAGRVTCCPLVRYVEYAPPAVLRLQKRRDRQTDGRTPDRYIALTGQRNKWFVRKWAVWAENVTDSLLNLSHGTTNRKNKYVRFRGRPYIHTCRSYAWPARWTNRQAHGPRALSTAQKKKRAGWRKQDEWECYRQSHPKASERAPTSSGCANRVVANKHTIRFVRFWACWGASGGAKIPKMCYSLPWSPMNHRAKFDAASFIFGGEIHKRTDTHTEKKQTVTNISTPCLSACVDNNENKTKNRNPSEHKIRQEPYSAEPILRPEWSIWWEQKDLWNMWVLSHGWNLTNVN